jgi:hypothetical protein
VEGSDDVKSRCLLQNPPLSWGEWTSERQTSVLRRLTNSLISDSLMAFEKETF